MTIHFFSRNAIKYTHWLATILVSQQPYELSQDHKVNTYKIIKSISWLHGISLGLICHTGLILIL